MGNGSEVKALPRDVAKIACVKMVGIDCAAVVRFRQVSIIELLEQDVTKYQAAGCLIVATSLCSARQMNHRFYMVCLWKHIECGD
jgi:hypothetical protein